MIEKKCTTCKNLLFKYEPCGTQIVSCDEGMFFDDYETPDEENDMGVCDTYNPESLRSTRPGSMSDMRPCEAWSNRWIAESNPNWRG